MARKWKLSHSADYNSSKVYMTPLKTQIFDFHKRSYNSDHYSDSDSVASENRPLAGLLNGLNTGIIPTNDPCHFLWTPRLIVFLTLS